MTRNGECSFSSKSERRSACSYWGRSWSHLWAKSDVQSIPDSRSQPTIFFMQSITIMRPIGKWKCSSIATKISKGHRNWRKSRSEGERTRKGIGPVMMNVFESTLSGYMCTTICDLRSFAWINTTLSIYLILSCPRLERERVFLSGLFGFRLECSLAGVFSLFVIAGCSATYNAS